MMLKYVSIRGGSTTANIIPRAKIFRGRKSDGIVRVSSLPVIFGSLSALPFQQFYSWRTCEAPSKAFFDAVGLFENSDQSSMCLGLTRNAKTNGEHFFSRVFHLRMQQLTASRESLVITMIYVSRLLFVIDISSQMVCTVDGSANRRRFCE